VTIVSPGFIDTDFTATVPDAKLRAEMAASKAALAISPDAIGRRSRSRSSSPTTSTSTRSSFADELKAD